MAPRSDESSEIQVTHSNDDGAEIKLPFKDRFIIRVTNLLHSTRLFIYNKEKQTFFGNTSSSWIKISTYYSIFYICLGFFYCGMVAVFGAILSRQSPRYFYNDSRMNDAGNVYVGMGFRPMINIQSTAINIYSDTASQNITITSLSLYQKVFLTQYDSTYLQECSPTEPASTLQGGRSCQFSWTDIVTSETHPCSETNRYGWTAGQPCILVKLNKIYGWTPIGNMTKAVANATGQPVLPVDQRIGIVFITCNGKTTADQNALGNNMTFYSILHPLGIPNYGGIPFYFFPYTNSQEHVQPFVLVQFTSLPFEQKITVECRAWAENIQQYTLNTASRGMVTFTIYRSSKSAPIQ